MKKFFTLLSLSFLSFIPLSAQSMIDINGTLYPIDTTAHYQAGPGVWHTRFTINIGANVHHCYVLEIDMKNPYNKVEEWQSGMEFGKTQRLEDAHVQMDAENHRPIGGVNCNFWVVTSQNVGTSEGLLGQSFAGTARNGVLIGEPDGWLWGVDRGFVMVDRNERVWIEEMCFNGVLTASDGTTHPIRDVNRPRVWIEENELTLFNHYMGSKPTRATDGTEIIFSTKDWKMNGVMTCKVDSIHTQGGVILQEGMGALQGRGSGKEFLSKLKIGDEFTMNLGVVGTHNPTFQPDILQMVTGNCLVMRNGELTYRNWGDDYNERNYPRTMLATNNDGSKMWMMVAQLPGMYTYQMCCILRHAGATYAAGMDGGGSAQICLEGQVLNPTTEGSARAVANSIWVLSTAPDDSVITKIATSESVMKLPKYGVYKPEFNSYNQYGVLLRHNQPDVVLSCDESAGYINDNGEFVCLGDGVLTATCGSATTTVEVQITETEHIAIRLDSVIVMDDTHYPIEVNARVGIKDMAILPGALTWTIADPTICMINKDGELDGLQNGVTEVYGTLNGITDTLLVHVEIPESKPLSITNIENDWIIKTTPSSLKTEFRTAEDGQLVLWTNFTGGRAANTKFTINKYLYGLPEYLEIRYDAQAFPISKIATEFQSNNTSEKMNYTLETGEFTLSGESSIKINLLDVIGQGKDIAIYPIQWNYMTFFYDVKAEKKEYNFVWNGIWLHYANVSVGVDDVLDTQFNVFPNPASDELNIKGIQEATLVILYDLQGHEISRTTLHEDGAINIANVVKGNYLLQVGNETIKIIKK